MTGILRLAADFDNYRKADLPGTTNPWYSMQTSVLPLIFLRSRTTWNVHSRLMMITSAPVVEQIRKLWQGFSTRNGITPIDALKKSFDPGEHEAVAHVSSDETEGTVVDVLSPGTGCTRK